MYMKNLLSIIFLAIISIVSVSAQSSSCKQEKKQPRDKKVVEQQIFKLTYDYTEMIQRGEAAAIKCILAEDYILTDENGRTFTKAEDLATYENRQLEIKYFEIKNQKARIIGDNVVIANATINFKGTKKDKPFDITEQLTTIYIWREGRWQIISDHISFVK